MRTFALVLFGVAFTLGCVEKGPPPVDHNYVRQNLLATPPSPKRPVNADLGGKVVYLGADIDKETLKPGEKMTLVHYWKVVQPLGSGWRVFCHIRGGAKSDWMNIDAPAKMRDNYPTDQWKAGDIIRDEQIVSLKGDWASTHAAIHVGLYRKGSSNPKDRMQVVSGPGDGEGGVLVARLPVTPKSGAAAPGTPGYVIRKASGVIVVDGKGDDSSWAQAVSTGPFKDAEGGAPVGATTSAKLLWDDKNLYVLAELADPDVFSSYTQDDDPLWKEDTIEIFVDANRDGRGYVELQVNPNNAHFDAWFAATRAAGPGDAAYASNMVTAVTVSGTKDKRDDVDKGWTVEMAIPLEAVKGKDAAMALSLPPRPGDKWKLNLVRVEKGKDRKQIAASAWAQITIQDFHAIDRLVEVTFGDELGAAAPAATTAPAAPTEAPSGPSSTMMTTAPPTLPPSAKPVPIPKTDAPK